MTTITVDGLTDTIRGLDQLAQTSYTRAAADALTDVAFITQREEKKEVGRSFDGFVSFTERAFRVNKASFKKDPIQSEVFILPQQSRYLSFQIEGGRRDTADEIAVLRSGNILLPVNARLNKAGNFPSPKRFLARSTGTTGQAAKQFVGIPEGRPNDFDRYYGIWRRGGRGGRQTLTLIASFRRAVDYKPDTFDFFGVADTTFTKEFDDSFDKKLEDEISRLPPGWK